MQRMALYVLLALTVPISAMTTVFDVRPSTVVMQPKAYDGNVTAQETFPAGKLSDTLPEHFSGLFGACWPTGGGKSTKMEAHICQNGVTARFLTSFSTADCSGPKDAVHESPRLLTVRTNANADGSHDTDALALGDFKTAYTVEGKRMIEHEKSCPGLSAPIGVRVRIPDTCWQTNGGHAPQCRTWYSQAKASANAFHPMDPCQIQSEFTQGCEASKRCTSATTGYNTPSLPRLPGQADPQVCAATTKAFEQVPAKACKFRGCPGNDIGANNVCNRRKAPKSRSQDWQACPYQMPGNWRWKPTFDENSVAIKCVAPPEGEKGYDTDMIYQKAEWRSCSK